jgi:hypothetical protein
VFGASSTAQLLDADGLDGATAAQFQSPILLPGDFNADHMLRGIHEHWRQTTGYFFLSGNMCINHGRNSRGVRGLQPPQNLRWGLLYISKPPRISSGHCRTTMATRHCLTQSYANGINCISNKTPIRTCTQQYVRAVTLTCPCSIYWL